MAAPKETKEPSSAGWLAQTLAVAFALVAGLSRVVPHPWNFTPVGAVGLFAGSRLRFWHALAVPLGMMVFTDLLLWGIYGDLRYAPFHVSRLFVYPGILLYALLGRALAAAESSWRAAVASVLGSLQFFLLTNFGTWWFGELYGNPYPKTVEGLLTCYVAGLPFYSVDAPLGFFGATLLSDLGFTALFFGAYAVLAYVSAARPKAEPYPESVR